MIRHETQLLLRRHRRGSLPPFFLSRKIELRSYQDLTLSEPAIDKPSTVLPPAFSRALWAR
jgi:hypothetical protein